MHIIDLIMFGLQERLGPEYTYAVDLPGESRYLHISRRITHIVYFGNPYENPNRQPIVHIHAGLNSICLMAGLPENVMIRYMQSVALDDPQDQWVVRSEVDIRDPESMSHIVNFIKEHLGP